MPNAETYHAFSQIKHCNTACLSLQHDRCNCRSALGRILYRQQSPQCQSCLAFLPRQNCGGMCSMLTPLNNERRCCLATRPPTVATTCARPQRRLPQTCRRRTRAQMTCPGSGTRDDQRHGTLRCWQCRLPGAGAPLAPRHDLTRKEPVQRPQEIVGCQPGRSPTQLVSPPHMEGTRCRPPGHALLLVVQTTRHRRPMPHLRQAPQPGAERTKGAVKPRFKPRSAPWPAAGAARS